ncbi:MAG TPA: hypothetical protein VMC10_13575 [Stellaceae bacterium]|nr:hypothetical protein [Stellaceae bacterium]
MSYLLKHLPFVKEQIAFQQRMLEKFEGDTYRQKLHQTSKEHFEALAQDLAVANAELDAAPQSPTESQWVPPRLILTLSPKEIEGLPEELIKELSISEGDKTEFAILSVMEAARGIISLDRLLIELYKKTGEIHKRQALVSKLYRMGQKSQVFSVPGKKGVYSTRLITPDEAGRLFSGEGEPEQTKIDWTAS